MEKLVYGWVPLAFAYIIFLYLTTKMLVHDAFSTDKSSVKLEEDTNRKSQKDHERIDNLS